jgi:hypothetical protein
VRPRPSLIRPTLKPVPIVAGVVALALFWLTRPIWHGIVMFFWTSPLAWLPPIVALGAGLYMLRRSRRGWKTLDDLREGVRPPNWLIGFPIGAFFLFIFGGALQAPLVERSMYKATEY